MKQQLSWERYHGTNYSKIVWTVERVPYILSMQMNTTTLLKVKRRLYRSFAKFMTLLSVLSTCQIKVTSWHSANHEWRCYTEECLPKIKCLLQTKLNILADASYRMSCSDSLLLQLLVSWKLNPTVWSTSLLIYLWQFLGNTSKDKINQNDSVIFIKKSFQRFSSLPSLHLFRRPSTRSELGLHPFLLPCWYKMNVNQCQTSHTEVSQ